MQQDLDDGAARRLVAAVLLKATEDAQRGDDLARAWLASEGALWCEAALHFHLDLQRMDTDRRSGFERLVAAIERDPELSDDELAAITGLRVTSVTTYRNQLKRQPGWHFRRNIAYPLPNLDSGAILKLDKSNT